MTHRLADTFTYLIDIGKDALFSKIDDATKVILVWLGDSATGEKDTDAAELWGPPGYYGVPAAPTQGAASCQTISLQRGDHNAILATRDTRDSGIYGNLKAGERCIAAGFPWQGRILLKANGAVVLYTTSDNTPGGTSVSAYVGPDKIALSNQFGGLSIDSTGVTLTAGKAAVILSAAGDAKLVGLTATVSGSVAAIAGKVMTMLGVGATPITAVAYKDPASPAPAVLGSKTVFVAP